MAGFYNLDVEFVQQITKPVNKLQAVIAKSLPAEKVQRMAQWAAAGQLEVVQIQSQYAELERENQRQFEAANPDAEPSTKAPISDAMQALIDEHPEKLNFKDLPDVEAEIAKGAEKLLADFGYSAPEAEVVEEVDPPIADVDISVDAAPDVESEDNPITDLNDGASAAVNTDIPGV